LIFDLKWAAKKWQHFYSSHMFTDKELVHAN